jgi:hypothetical protein
VAPKVRQQKTKWKPGGDELSAPAIPPFPNSLSQFSQIPTDEAAWVRRAGALQEGIGENWQNFATPPAFGAIHELTFP